MHFEWSIYIQSSAKNVKKKFYLHFWLEVFCAISRKPAPTTVAMRDFVPRLVPLLSNKLARRRTGPRNTTIGLAAVPDPVYGTWQRLCHIPSWPALVGVRLRVIGPSTNAGTWCTFYSSGFALKYLLCAASPGILWPHTICFLWLQRCGWWRPAWQVECGYSAVSL